MAKGIERPTVTVATATSPSNLAAVPQLIKELADGVGCLESGCNEARQAMAIKARTLMQALETPRETMIKHCWAEPGVYAAILCGNECGLVSHAACKVRETMPSTNTLLVEVDGQER